MTSLLAEAWWLAAVTGAGTAAGALGLLLLGRLLGWKLIPLGLAAGFAFSFSTQPVETTNFVNDLRGLAGF